jgi:glucosamine-6-phosphate deaminase
MEVIIERDAESASLLAARMISRQLREKPDSVLGLAVGNTPILLYAELVRMHRAGYLDFRKVTTFNLDEYVGIRPDHPASFLSYMRQHLFDHVNMPPESAHIPDGMTEFIPGFCEAYEQAIRRAGGIDVQLLGIGVDGHLGFNEPMSSLASRTRLKSLTPRSIRDLAPQFGGEGRVPRHILTMGLGTIMEARQCLLMAFGSTKASAVARAVEGPVTAAVPASILQMHPVAKVIVDEAAASLLKHSHYYRWVYDCKPDWQRY